MITTKITSESKITIKAPPEEVYKYLKHLKYYYLWNSSLRYLSYEGPLKKGISYDSENIIFNKNVIKAHNIVTAIEPNKKIETENKLGMIKYKQTIKLKEQTKNTQVISKIVVLTPAQTFGLTTPVLKILADKELKTDLQTLKIVVENKLH